MGLLVIGVRLFLFVFLFYEFVPYRGMRVKFLNKE